MLIDALLPLKRKKQAIWGRFRQIHGRLGKSRTPTLTARLQLSDHGAEAIKPIESAIDGPPHALPVSARGFARNVAAGKIGRKDARGWFSLQCEVGNIL